MTTHMKASLALCKILTIALVLSGCGGGASTESNQAPPSTGGTSTYTGPAPAFPDVQAFRTSLWENIRGTDRCGECHTPGVQSPTFARSDDVNEAYAEALPLIDRDNPSLSRLVTKVGGGHNCWLAEPQACADIMTTWIENWVGTGSSAGREIQLIAPASIRDPGASKNFPDSPVGYGQIHNLLSDVNEGNCGRCHSGEAETPISPYFGSADINESYEAAKSKINLDVPAESRFVVRLRDEFHNCWSGSCASDAQEMLDAIVAFAGPLPTDAVDPNEFIFSKALQLGEGIIASGGNRFEGNQIAFYEFKTGAGNIAYDTSGVDPAIDLTLSGDVEWVGGWGINIRDGRAQGSTTDSIKLYNSILPTGEFAVEAWVAPANVTQEDAYMVSYSGSNNVRNFTLGQTLYNYDFLLRSSSAGPDPASAENGQPALSTADADERLQATLQHVVINFDPVNGRSIYVNGQWTGDMDPVAGGELGSWRNNFALILGNETSGQRQWEGVIRMVAIHNRVLTPEQIQQNFDVGVGEKFFLLFYLGDILPSITDPYLLIEVSQFDSYSYLFNEPRFISLDPNVNPGVIDIAGIRIGINGRLAEVGQGFQKIDTRDPSFTGTYGPDGLLLSRQGTIIALEKGPDLDEFYLTFDVLGGAVNVFTEPATLAPATPPDGAPVPDVGLRTFDEINATLAALTGVSPQDSNVELTYQRVKQQLPTVEAADGFLAAHQMGIAQLAVEYCNSLVDDADLRDAYWNNLSFPAPTTPSTAASMNQLFGLAADRDDILDPLLDRIALPATPANGISSQPDIAASKTELNWLIDQRLTTCYDPNTNTDNCEAGRSNTVLKAVCAAALGNAAMLMQ